MPSHPPANVGRGPCHEGSNPVAGQLLYVNPHNPAALQAARWRGSGRKTDAAAMGWLAKRPTALWLTDPAGVTSRVRGETQRAARAGRTALLVAYHVPGARLRELLGGRLGLARGRTEPGCAASPAASARGTRS